MYDVYSFVGGRNCMTLFRRNKQKELAMNHDYESKAWADNHHVMSDGIANMFSAIARGARQLRVRMTTKHSANAPAIASPLKYGDKCP